MSYNFRNDVRSRFYNRPPLPMGYKSAGDGVGYKMSRYSSSGPAKPGPPANIGRYGTPPSVRGPSPPSTIPPLGPLSSPQPPPIQDPSSYTQPAYTTQPGYTTQQSSPKPVVKERISPPPCVTMTVKEVTVDIPQQTIVESDEVTPSNPLEETVVDQAKRTLAPRPWLKKVYNMRVSKKIRKRRQNARLRHILAPKNAMMVLHELHPELKIVATEQLNAANQTVYTVDIEIEGKTYRGHGMSKLAAKQTGCENALKAVLLEKIANSNVKVNQDDENSEVATKQEQESEVTTNSSEQSNEGTESEKQPFRKYAEDDVPWGSLASFALYKLFSEWQSQGFQLPATNSSVPPFILQKMPGFGMAPMKKIPDDANKKHPVQLLNQLRPGSQYSETREGTPPNLTFTFSVVVDGQTYQGVGSSKKDAKKECAKAALQAMGVKYD